MISIIVACDSKYGIGKNGKIPWNYKQDLKFFRDTTMGHHVIMGRKTFNSIGGPLEGRHIHVISRNPKYFYFGPFPFDGNTSVTSYGSLEDAIEDALKSEKEIFIAGGEEVYKRCLELDIVSKIYMSYIMGDYSCDRFFKLPNNFTSDLYGRIWTRKKGELSKGDILFNLDKSRTDHNMELCYQYSVGLGYD